MLGPVAFVVCTSMGFVAMTQSFEDLTPSGIIRCTVQVKIHVEDLHVIIRGPRQSGDPCVVAFHVANASRGNASYDAEVPGRRRTWARIFHSTGHKLGMLEPLCHP